MEEQTATVGQLLEIAADAIDKVRELQREGESDYEDPLLEIASNSLQAIALEGPEEVVAYETLLSNVVALATKNLSESSRAWVQLIAETSKHKIAADLAAREHIGDKKL